MKNFMQKVKNFIEKVKAYFKNFSSLSTIDKIKVLLRWPALCCSAIIFLFFMIVLIVNCTKPYSNGPYTYAESMGGINVNIEMRLDNNGIATMETVMTNAGHKQYQKEDVYYEVVDGKLIYSYTRSSYEKNEMGKINAFEIIVTEGETSITLKNHGEEIARALYIIFMLIGLCGAGASGVYIFMSKYKKTSVKAVLNTKKNSTQMETEPVSEDVPVSDDEPEKVEDAESV